MKVVLNYHINLFFKFVIIKIQLITRYYHLVLREKLHLHLQEIQTPPILPKLGSKVYIPPSPTHPPPKKKNTPCTYSLSV